MSAILQINGEQGIQPQLRRWLEHVYLNRVVLIFGLWLLLRVPLALMPPTYSATDTWREADTASIAHGFYSHRLPIFYPQINWGGDGPGYVETEFQAYPFIVAQLYRLFGEQFWLGRVVSLLFSAAAFGAFYLLMRQFLESRALFWALLFVTISPISIRYSVAFMPEATVFFFYVLALHFFCRWLRDEDRKHLYWAAMSTALAILVKPTSIHIGLIFLVLLIGKYRLAFIRNPHVWAFGLISLVPSLLWYLYARNLYLTYGNTFGLFSGGDSKFGGLNYWLNPAFYGRLLQLQTEWILNGIGILPFLMGLIVSIRRRSPALLVIGVGTLLIYLMIVARYSQEEWGVQYHIYALPIAALGFGIGMNWLRGRLQRVQLPVRSVTAVWVFNVVVVGLMSLWMLRLYTGTLLQPVAQPLWDCAQAVIAHVPDNALIIVSTTSTADAPPGNIDGSRNNFEEPNIFYYSHRYGWSLPADWHIPDLIEQYRARGAQAFIITEQSLLLDSPGLLTYLQQNTQQVGPGIEQGCGIYRFGSVRHQADFDPGSSSFTIGSCWEIAQAYPSASRRGNMLGERLRAARHARFVGRLAEKQVFEEALRATQPPWYVLHLFGPGGVGKTTLLQEFALICEREAVHYTYLDVRSTEPAPQAFIEALARAVGSSSQDNLLIQLASHRRYVILIDTYEALAPLDDWLREVFLPTLPESALVVLAGRDAPAAAWRADPGWQSLMQVISLRNLDSNDSQDYLARRQVPGEQHKAVLSFTYGHPLALSLVADVFAQRRDVQFQPEEMPDIVRTLLEKLVQKLPGSQHRSALEACALVRLMTESLLATMLDVDDAHELFVWLSSLSFMETGTEGVFPHDLAREALATDLRWRNPERYTELHQRARKHYFERFQQSSGPVQQRVLLDYIFLHRDNPLVKPYFEWQAGGSVIADSLQPADIAALTSIVQKHEGQDSARIASYWFSRQPDTVTVMRDNTRQPVGFVMMLALHRATPDDIAFDPAVRAARNYLQNNTALRPGESATLFRFWMDRDTYQEVSPVQTQIFLNMVRHYLSTPGLAFTFLPTADPDFWMLAFSYADLARLPQVDFSVDGRRYGVYGHDWRIVPPIAWLELMGEREVSSQANATPPPPVEQVIVLSESEFTEAVQAALRDYARPDMLHGNPLLRSKLVMEASGLNADEDARAAALRDLLRATAESLQQSPRDAKFYRSLHHTYFQPAPTQEQAAEILDLPFSSYRRHLKSGVTRVTEILWNQEIK